MGAYLEATVESKATQFQLAGNGACRIGRVPGNTIVLQDNLASRTHAVIQASDSGVFYLTDLGSTNGTYVNGARITAPVVLQPGDCIHIGNHEFYFRQAGPEADRRLLGHRANMLAQMKVITVLVVDMANINDLRQRLGFARTAGVIAAFHKEAGQVFQAMGAWGHKNLESGILGVWNHAGSAEITEMTRVLRALVCIRDGASLSLSVTTPVRIKAAINTGMASIANFSDLANTNPNTLGEVSDVAFGLTSPEVGGDRDLVLGADSFYVIRSAPGVNGLLETSTVSLPGHAAPVKAFGAHLHRLEAMIRMLNESSFNTTMAARPFNPAQFK